MVVKQYFPTTRITFSKGKQNLSKLVASFIYYLYNRQNIIISVVQVVKLLIRKDLRLAPNKAEKFLQLLNICSYSN